MRKSACIVSISLIAVLCYASCATISPTPSWQPTAEALLKSPAPAVNFIDYLDPYPGQTGPSSGKLCMSINPEAIYELGDYKRDFDNKWKSLFRLTLDGAPISFAQFSYISNLMCEASIDKRCAVPPAMGCIEDLTLTKGLHAASLQATSMSGKAYSYAWAFRIDSIADNEKDFEQAFMDRIANGNLGDPFVANWATSFPFLVKTPIATEAR